MIPLKSTVVKDIILPEAYAGDLDLVEDFEEYLEKMIIGSIEFIKKNATEILTQSCITKTMLENTKMRH